MSNCTSVSSTPKSLQPPISCIQQPLTKAALFVIAFLLAGGAAASYFTALGIAVTAAFSAASLATFITACVVTARCPVPVPPSIEELVRSLPAYDYLHDLRETANLSEEDQKRLVALSPYIAPIFGETIDKTALQSLINHATHDPNKLFFLVASIIEVSELNLNRIAFVLEELRWPNEEIKRQTLTYAFAYAMIDREYVDSQNEDKSKWSANIVFFTEKVFGMGDFCEAPELISPLVSEALGVCTKLVFEAINEELQNKIRKGKAENDTKTSLTLFFQQSKSTKCHFPALVIIPALPHLKNLPGLIALDLSDIGTKEGDGFLDEDADLLLELLKTNPRLVELRVNTKSMSFEKREEFKNEKMNILANRNSAPPHIALPSKEKMEEMVRSLPSYDFHTLTQENFELTEEEKEICQSLQPYIETIFDEYIDEIALQSLINYAADDPNRLMLLTIMIMEINMEALSLGQITSALEELKWPDEKVKKDTLLVTLAMCMSDSVSLEGENKSDIVVQLKKIFGPGNFYEYPEFISPLACEALGFCIKNIFEENQDPVSLTFRICEDDGCIFPASAMKSVLPYLQNHSELTSLDLSDIGSTVECGFEDEDIDSLLEIVKTNPSLVKFKVNTESMSSEKREAFEKEKQQILDSRQIK